MYGFSDHPNIMPLTRFSADRQGSSRYSGRMCAELEHLFYIGKAETGRRECLAGEGDDPALGVERRLAAAERLELGAGDLVAGVVAGAHERRRTRRA